MFTPQDLRRYPTVPEKLLWRQLRAHQCMGYKFRRQHAIGRVIVDFICLPKKLIIELDGTIHDKQKAYDLRRDAWLRREGYHVVRFKNSEVEEDIASVMNKIKAILRHLTVYSG